jgi:hypothetical protein
VVGWACEGVVSGRGHMKPLFSGATSTRDPRVTPSVQPVIEIVELLIGCASKVLIACGDVWSPGLAVQRRESREREDPVGISAGT